MNTANKQYGRLTKKGGYTKELDLKQELGYSYIYNRLSELEDKIENGTLVFIDEPFWSEYHDCWAVFQRTEDIVQTCYITVNQAKDYKSRKEVRGIEE